MTSRFAILRYQTLTFQFLVLQLCILSFSLHLIFKFSVTSGPMRSYKIFQFISAKKQCFILLFFNLSGIWATGENLPSNWLPQFHFLSITTLHDSFCILYISFPVYLFHAISVSHSNLIPKLFTLSYFYTCLQQFFSLTLFFRSSLALSAWSTNVSINTPTLFKKQTNKTLQFVLNLNEYALVSCD